MALQPDRARGAFLRLAEAVCQFEAVHVDERIVEFGHRDHRRHAGGVDVAYAGTVRKKGGIGAVVGGDLGGVGIVRTRFGTHPAADHNVPGDARTGRAVQSRVVGVRRGVGGPGRMAHQVNARRVPAKARNVGERPFQCRGHILACRRILELGRKPVFHVDTDHAMARKTAQRVGVDLGRALLVALDKGAAVGKHQHRRGRGPVPDMHVEHLPGVRAVGDVACHGKAVTRRARQHRAVQLGGFAHMTGDILRPARSDFGHAFGEGCGNRGQV